ncbi:m46L [Myxoma virus]|nr:m46L [Myxoma virus]
MASPLIYLLFFIIFLVLTYYFNKHPTNKLKLSVDKLNRENKIIKQRDDAFPVVLNTTVFTRPETPVPTKVHTYYDSATGVVTMLSNNKKRIFRLDFDDDVRTLLPILLLSK